MVGIAALTAATLGTGVVVDGLACMPTVPASLTVSVGPGSITQLSSLDATAYGSLAADVTDQIVKTGINLQPVSFTFAAPVSSGRSINYLIEASFSESDADPAVLPYVNAANPSQALSGPNNSGTAQNTQRIQRVQLQVKPGVATMTGAQLTPPVDTGWVGLYVVTVNYGQSAITATNISVLPAAPFLQYKLPALRPGFSTMQVFTSSGEFVVPNGVTAVRAELIGGGGGGGYHASMPGGGGGAGGRAVGIVSGLTPGQVMAITVGAGGAIPGSPAAGGGGITSFAGMQAQGGVGGGGGTVTGTISNAGGSGGVATGGQVNMNGSDGGDAIVVACRGGDGGGPGNGRGTSGPIQGISAPSYGGGGGGGGCSTASSPVGYPGGAGGGGLVIIEY